MIGPRPARVAALALALLLPAVGRAQTQAEQVEFFEKKIRPVLVEKCYRCHSAKAKKLRGGLLLDSRDGLRKGGDSGPAIVPGNPATSLLVKALHYDGDEKMPPKGKLPARVVADFERWVKLGAVDPRNSTAAAGELRRVDVSAGKQFWAFQPPHRHPAPDLHNRNWSRQPIDRFILARLEQAGIGPSPPANRRTLIRRVTFDLIGLPPTPAEVEAFVNDRSPDAYENVVERLLASPHFGERWARVWLDVARYAEDQAHIVGNDQSLCYPNAYLYRDWVIGAFNKDLPYDRFIQLQLAADEIDQNDVADLPALGLLGLGPKYYDRRSLAVMADEWADRVDVVGRGLLGLTVACARCHDHKFDPIPTEDYYALAGIFSSTQMYNRPLDAKCAKKPNGEAKQPKDAMHVVRDGKPADLTIFVRGDVTNKGPTVPRHFLHVLCAGEPTPFRQGSGRLELARAITDRGNPLTARVFVNRVWGQVFGRPLVGTPSNFGKLGDRPTHPDLLDDLSVRFMDGGWSMKRLIRALVLSATYQQSAERGTRNAERKSVPRSALRAPRWDDPENRLLGRMNRRRLSVEEWRDAVLAVAGQLDQRVDGPSMDPASPTERRRTIYSRVSRLSLNPLLAMFDFPDPNLTADRRVETTTPLQKLFVMNSPFMVKQAEALADRLSKEVGDSDQRFIERAYLLLYARPATAAEARLGLAYLRAGHDRAEQRQQYAQVLLAANEFLYVD